MNIQLGFDHQKLLRYANRGSPLVFEVVWEHEGQHYPAEHWADFGAVIMVWWLRVAVELYEEANEAEFLFMDGPYALRAKYQRETDLVELTPRGQDWVWRISLTELARELIRASNMISRELLSAGVGEADRKSLEYGISRIRATILAAS